MIFFFVEVIIYQTISMLSFSKSFGKFVMVEICSHSFNLVCPAYFANDES